MVVPAIVIAILSFAVLSYYVSYSGINQTINEKMYTSLYAADLEIQLEFYKNAAITTSLAKHASALDKDSFDIEKHKIYLEESISYNTNTFAAGVWFEPYAFDSGSYYSSSFLYVDNNNEVVYVPDYGNYEDYFSKEWYKKGVESSGDFAWSNVYNDPVSNISMVTAAKPFYNKDGKLMGIVTADMKLENIRSIVNNISVGETGKAFVIGSNGEYISFFDESKSLDNMIWDDADEDVARLGGELMNNLSGTASFNKDGKRLRVYYMTMANVNWTLAITFEESEITVATLSSFVIMIVIPVIGLLLVTAGIYMVSRYILKIVNKVNSFADLSASGDFSKRIDVTETDEFGFMEQRLNIMISNMNDMGNRSAALLKLAEDAGKSKSDFLSGMSHEIRTPMNAIIGMTQIAKSSKDDVRIKDCLEKIDNASKHLLALINDILDMSKIEANKLDMDEANFNLKQTLTNIYNMMLVKAEEKNQLLVLNIDENVPMCVIGDKLRFSQVVTNLISNAVKFTPNNGNIAVSMSEADEANQDDNYCVLKISVADNGIGLSQEQQAKLFKSFEQGDSSISRRFGGTGLGLAISKRIVEMMGGDIGLTSELDKGSVFSFTVKVRRGSGKPDDTKNQTEHMNADVIKPLKILVADDSIEANEYMKHVLNSLKLDCDNVYDGLEALEAVEKAAADNRPYDIVFMDYIMPNLNGIDSAKRIRQISDDSTAIIMVSIYDWKDIEQTANESGVFKHITKPFSPSCVLNVINEVSYGTIMSSHFKTCSFMSGFGGNTILLVEDIDINREIVVSILEDTGVNIEFAENGVKAVEMFRAEPYKYDLILMDIQMPKMGGYEATRQIRRMDTIRAKTVPIIAMTANALSEDVKRCKEAGMNDHLAKPIEPEKILFKINDYFFMKDYLDNEIW